MIMFTALLMYVIHRVSYQNFTTTFSVVYWSIPPREIPMVIFQMQNGTWFTYWATSSSKSALWLSTTLVTIYDVITTLSIQDHMQTSWWFHQAVKQMTHHPSGMPMSLKFIMPFGHPILMSMIIQSIAWTFCGYGGLDPSLTTIGVSAVHACPKSALLNGMTHLHLCSWIPLMFCGDVT